MKNNSICLIAVNYNSDKFTINLVKNLKTRKNRINFEIIIVDNTEAEDRAFFIKQLVQENENVNCINSKKNLGYFGGARLGYEHYIKNHGSPPDYLIICNVDISIMGDELIETLANYNLSQDIGVIAPSIISKRSLNDKNPKILSRPSKLKMHFYKYLFMTKSLQNIYILIYLIKNKVKYLIQNKKSVKVKIENIYAPLGSFIIFTNSYYLRGGYLNYPCFLVNEDLFVAESAINLNLKIIYDNKLTIYDEEHISTGLFRSKRIASYVAISSNYVANKYFK